MANVISDETMEYVGILAKLELSPEEKEEAKETAAADKKVGVFLPSAADDSRWALDGESFQTALEGDGYDAEIFFADEDTDTQESQIQSIRDD